jgi:glycosyltransferase involved in cell wall biosynthesis
MKNEFTALMPVYGKECPVRLERALSSVFASSVIPTEVLVVCDGPLGNNLERVLEHFSDYGQLRIERINTPVGLIRALNHGIEKATYELIARCDSDDINAKNRFENNIRLINQGFEVAGGQIVEVDENLNRLPIKRVPVRQVDIVDYMSHRNPFNHMTVMFKASVVKEVGGYPEIFAKEDYALWMKLAAKKIRMANSPDILVKAFTGSTFYKRRGNLRAVKSEIELFRLSYRLGIWWKVKIILSFLVRVFVLSLPSPLLRNVYRLVLRK